MIVPERTNMERKYSIRVEYYALYKTEFGERRIFTMVVVSGYPGFDVDL